MDYEKGRPTGEMEAAGQPTNQELRENAMNCLENVSNMLKNTEKKLCRQTNEEIETSILGKDLHCEVCQTPNNNISTLLFFVFA